MKPKTTQILFLTLSLIVFSSCGSKYEYKFQDPRFSVEERVNDLISKLTLEEKISQMVNNAPEISRLGIPAYGWWNEGLHGVARAGIATVFPEPIGMAASFNDSLLFHTAEIISDEFRAKYNDAVWNGNLSQYYGLTVWSPNINIFRDPRWGRGQETYGEDPWLTSRMGVAFVEGLQGNDPKFLKVIATPKHYVVHSGPESLRHTIDVRISGRDFMETYTPAFKACIKEGKASSVMSAYNRLWTKSCSGSDTLLTTILRDDWGFKGYVVSDCGAVDDIWKTHKIVSTAAEAAAISVKSGCDLNCGDTFLALKEAVAKGYITEKEIDQAVRRLFTARFRLGMFEPKDHIPFGNIAMSVVDKPESRSVALRMAESSLVLLKNQNNLLPLSKDLKNIFVTGPNAGNIDILNGNYFGLASKVVTPLEGLKSKLPGAKISYTIGCPLIGDRLYDFIPDSLLSADGGQGWKAEYFDNTKLKGSPVFIGVEKRIDFKVEGGPVTSQLSHDSCSVRFTTELMCPLTGEYVFAFNSQPVWTKAGFTFSIDNQKLIDTWNSKPSQEEKTVRIRLIKGRKYKIITEYFKEAWSAELRLKWATPDNETGKATELAKNSDVIIFFGGISPQLEGEEMPVPYDGFKGGDRTSLDLPAVQTRYLQELKKTGKPIVLVLHSGSALSINWEAENIPAIIEAWYPGEEGGTAIANVLFGDHNPSGRLPLTFYKSVDQLPPFEDYNMTGRTYKYFRGEPLYKFGFGLSYSTFSYSNLILPKAIKTGESLGISVDVQNTGKMDGNEIVQLYIKDIEASVPVPFISLQGFRSVHLLAGEKKTLEFKLKPEQLAVITDELKYVVEPGVFEVSAGGCQPDEKAVSDQRVIIGRFKALGEKFEIR
jgi:beta-glucosidase